MRSVNEFLKGFQYFYQKVYIKMELRVQEFLKTELRCVFQNPGKNGLSGTSLRLDNKSKDNFDQFLIMELGNGFQMI